MDDCARSGGDMQDREKAPRSGHASPIAKEVRYQILHHVPRAAGVTVHVDPASEPAETHHRSLPTPMMGSLLTVTHDACGGA